MSWRGIRAALGDLREGERLVQGAVARHLGNVLRLRDGDTFTAFDPDTAEEADGVVVGSARGGLRVKIGPPRAATLRVERPLLWVQGLAKGDKCDAVVRDATELGATLLVVAATARSVVRLGPAAAEARRARWRRIAREAARQSGRGECPLVDGPCSWDEALARAGSDAARFCLYERATLALAPLLREALASGAPLAFAAGPEGGLADDEVSRAGELGWKVASLGPRILRTETVAAAVLGAVAIC